MFTYSHVCHSSRMYMMHKRASGSPETEVTSDYKLHTVGAKSAEPCLQSTCYHQLWTPQAWEMSLRFGGGDLSVYMVLYQKVILPGVAFLSAMHFSKTEAKKRRPRISRTTQKGWKSRLLSEFQAHSDNPHAGVSTVVQDSELPPLPERIHRPGVRRLQSV